MQFIMKDCMPVFQTVSGCPCLGLWPEGFVQCVIFVGASRSLDSLSLTSMSRFFKVMIPSLVKLFTIEDDVSVI